MDDVELPIAADGTSGAPQVARGRTLTPAQLMERLQVSENTIYHELQNGSLKAIAFRVGRQYRVSEAALERLIAGQSD